MKKNIIYFFIFLFSFANAQDSFMRKTYEKVSKVKIRKMLSDKSWERITILQIENSNFYIKDNVLLVEDKVSDNHALYYDANNYLSKMNKILDSIRNGPLDNRQADIADVELNKERIINAFLKKIDYDISYSNLDKLNVDTLNKKIKKISTQQLYENFVLEIILLVGEVVRKTNKSEYKWILKPYGSKGFLYPILIKKNGYSINIYKYIQKEFMETGEVGVKKYIDMFMLL